PGRAAAEAREELARVAVDAHAGSDVGHIVVHAHAAADLADVEAALRAALQVEPGGAMHVDPLRLELAVAGEDRDAVVLAVGDVEPAVGVAEDVVGDVTLARIGAR